DSANAFGDLDVSQMPVPGTKTFQLSSGDKVVYSRSGTIFAASDVTVTGPDGEPVSVRPVTGTLTVGSGGDSYIGRARFTAPTAGSYKVEIDSFAPGRAAVGPDLLPGVGGGALLMLLSFVVGGGLFAVGLILLIIGLVKRSNFKKSMTPPTYGGGSGMMPPQGFGGYGPMAPPTPGAYPPAGGVQQPGW
ncbi:MAG: hypothetical protein N2037_10125, partial [Acidimicrobiales bacterium]|nr:hypothetical protein [Acidimicrobiales bacterium]